MTRRTAWIARWIVIAAAAAAVLVAATGRADQEPSAEPELVLRYLYSPDAKDLLVPLINRYNGEQHQWGGREIRIDGVKVNSGQAEVALADGREQAVLWTPASSLWGGLLNHSVSDDWVSAENPNLVFSPQVIAIWKEFADALRARKPKIGWKDILDLATSKRTWADYGHREWKRFKLGHTNPTRSNSGLMALLLMTFEFYGKRSGLEVGDVLKPEYQAFVAEIERGVTKFEMSTGTFMVDMIRFGPSKYDIAVVYENLAIEQLENAQGRWGNLRVYYPEPTLWSDHPAGVIAAPWVTEKQNRAARQLLTFLRAKPQQELALAFGFRPADPSVAVKTTDPKNPWNRLAPYGISVDVPTAATAPEGPVARNLMMMWSRVVGAR